VRCCAYPILLLVLGPLRTDVNNDRYMCDWGLGVLRKETGSKFT